MTTPDPLTQQRQFVRDFLAADKQRSRQESAAQQQHAAGEKAAKEQTAVSHHTAEQQHAAAIKQQDGALNRQNVQVSAVIAAIDDSLRRWRNLPFSALGQPNQHRRLLDASPAPPKANTGGNPLLHFQAGAEEIKKMVNAGESLISEYARQQRQQLLRTVVIFIVVLILFALAVAGVFIMGSSQTFYDQPQRTVHLGYYWIMQTEVTNAQ